MVPSKPDSCGTLSHASENKERFGAPKNGKVPAPTKTGIINANQGTPPTRRYHKRMNHTSILNK